jgi:two-component system chemotaxis response regulator CheY
MRILVVHESKTMRNVQKSVLAQLGHTDVDEACDGRDALDRIAAAAPDLVLIDASMRKMDGVTFLRTLRRSDRSTPVLLIAGECDRVSVVEAVKAGATDYLVKPISPEHLGQRIAEAAARTRSSAA